MTVGRVEQSIIEERSEMNKCEKLKICSKTDVQACAVMSYEYCFLDNAGGVRVAGDAIGRR